MFWRLKMIKSKMILTLFLCLLCCAGGAFGLLDVIVEGKTLRVESDKSVIFNRSFDSAITSNSARKGFLSIGLQDGNFYVFSLKEDGVQKFHYHFEGDEHCVSSDGKFLYVRTVDKKTNIYRLYIFDMWDGEKLLFEYSAKSKVVYALCAPLSMDLTCFCIGLKNNIFYMFDGEKEVIFEEKFDDEVDYVCLDKEYLHIGLKNGKLCIVNGSYGDKIVFEHQFKNEICLSRYNKKVVSVCLNGDQIRVFKNNNPKNVYKLKFEQKINSMSQSEDGLRAYVVGEKLPYRFVIEDRLKQVFEGSDNKKRISAKCKIVNSKKNLNHILYK